MIIYYKVLLTLKRLLQYLRISKYKKLYNSILRNRYIDKKIRSVKTERFLFSDR